MGYSHCPCGNGHNSLVGCYADKYFSDTLQTFLSVVGYWTVMHITPVTEERFIFRRGWNEHDFDAWNNWQHGANTGHELTFAFSGVVFPLFRWIGKHYEGR